MTGPTSRETLLKFPEERTLACGKYEHELDFNEFTDPFVADWKRVRSLIEHEDELINQRTTWLLSVNAFLFTSFFLSHKSDTTPDLAQLSTWLSLIIPLAGVSMSYAIMTGIVAAVNQLKRTENWWLWRSQLDPRNYKICADDCDNNRHPQIVGFREKGKISHDFMITKALSGLIIVVWLALLVAFFRRALSAEIPMPTWTIIFAIMALFIVVMVRAKT